MALSAWLAPVQFTLSLLVAILVMRGMREGRLAWPLLPLSSLLPAGLLTLAFLPVGLPAVGVASGASLAAFGLLGTACGVALGLTSHAGWNLRRSWAVAAAVMVVALELAALSAWWTDQIAPQDRGTPVLLLLSGVALAMAASRRGATPEAARWTRRLRYSTAITVGLALGAWWLRAEALGGVHVSHALDADHAANAAMVTAWAWLAGLAMALVPSLVSLRLRWVRAAGPAALGVGLLAAPGILLVLVLANRAQCADHQPKPDSFAERIAYARTRGEVPWCRASAEYTPVCEDERSRWGRKDDHWAVEGPRFRGDAVRSAFGEEDLGDGLFASTYWMNGRWHPSELDAALAPSLEDAEGCMGSVSTRFKVRFTAEEEPQVLAGVEEAQQVACIEKALARFEAPDPGCDGSARFAAVFLWTPDQRAELSH